MSKQVANITPLGMTDAQAARAVLSISKHRQRPCPLCGGRSADLGGIFHAIVNESPDYKTEFRSTLPMVAVSCSTCHAITFYDTSVLKKPAARRGG